MRTTKVLLACVSMVLAGVALAAPKGGVAHALHVASDRTVKGFGWPESVGCDTAHHVLYVSQFGGDKPNPPAKDGKGYISKVAPDGKVLEERAFDVTMNKPKGIWIRGNRLWVTDIDALWIFDTRSKKGRRIALPGIQFANDVVVTHGTAYVSDNRSDQLYTVKPANFLRASVQPKVESMWKGKGVHPNGLWPGKGGKLLMVGFQSARQPRAIYAMGRDGQVDPISQPIGRLDGLHEMRDGSLIVTDWDSGSVFQWDRASGKINTLARDFKGPADLCVMGRRIYVPDLVKGEVRILELR